MNGFDSDPDDPIGMFGWGLVRVYPWYFAGLFVTAAEAHAAREEFGAEYIVRHTCGASGPTSSDGIETTSEPEDVRTN